MTAVLGGIESVDPDAVIEPPFCRAYPIQTWVKFDGVPINARSSERTNRGEETLVEGLEFSWGRQSSVDQPDTSSCTLNVNQKLLPDQAERVLARNYYPDPSHEYGLPPMSATPTAGKGIIALDRARHHTGRQSLRFTNQSTVTTTNLATRPNPTGSTGGWASNNNANWTSTRDSAVVRRAGTWSARSDLVAGGGGIGTQTILSMFSVGLASGSTNTDRAAVVGGSTYTISVWWRASVANARVQITVAFFDEAANTITSPGNQPVQTTTVAANTWARNSYTVTAPAGATRLRPGFAVLTPNVTTLTTGSEQAWITDCQIELGTEATDYFDGDTPDGIFDYAWTGTAAASTSARTGPGTETRRNLLPTPTWGTGGRWTYYGASGSGSIGAGDVYQGRTSIRATLTNTTTVTNCGIRTFWTTTIGGANNPLLQTGRTYWVAADVYVSADMVMSGTAPTVRLIGRDDPNNDSNAVTFDPSTPVAQSVVQGQWTRLAWRITVNADRTATGLYFAPSIANTGQAAGAYFQAGRVLVTEVQAADTAAPTYFDGDTPATDTDLFGWLGTAGLSPSLDLTRATGTVYKTSVTITTPAQMGLVEGDTIYFSAWVYIPVTALPYAYVLRLGGTGVTGTLLRAPTLRNQWVQVTGSAPVINAAGTVVVTIYGPTRYGNNIGFEDFAVSDQPVDFNGDTPPVGNFNDLCAPDDQAYAYRWEGTAGASISDRLRPAYHQRRLTDIFHTGMPVEVWVGADGTAEAGTDTLNWAPHAGAYDPDTEYNDAVADPISITGATDNGRLAAWITGTQDATWSGRIVFPPDPFVPEGTSPDAWDNIPKMYPGQTWNVEATVWVPPGASVQLATSAYTGPHKSEYLAVAVAQTPIVGEWGWQTVTGTITLPPTLNDPDGYWMTLGIDVDGFASWDDVLGAWDDLGSWSWDDYGRIGIADLAVYDPEAARRESLVWAGTIQTVSWTGLGTTAVAAAISASDPGADLANDTISDTPWPQQTLETRVNRINTLARLDLDINIDVGIRGVLLAYRDVDSEAALSLLQDMAKSAGGVLWIATHATRGAYLWFEDLAARASAWQLVVNPTTGVVTISGHSADASHIIISGDDIVFDQITVTQDPSQVTTTVDVTWESEVPPTQAGDQTTTESHTVTVTDDTAVAKYGLHNQQIETELTSEAAAIARGQQALALARDSDFLLSGVTVDTLMLECDVPEQPVLERLNNMLDLLDGTRRLGAAVLLADLPAWVPTDVDHAVYVEGGQYRLENSRWVLDLTVTPSGAAAHTVTWDELAPSGITWDQMDPSITWDDLAGVGAPTT